MKQQFLKIFFLVILSAASAQTALAQTRDGTFQFTAGAGGGWNAPVRFDLDINGEYYWNDNISVGLDFDTFLGTINSFDFIPFARYHFDLKRWPRFSPYVGTGMGVLFNTNSQSWFDFMLPELGFFYELTPHFYIGPNASMHVLAGSTSTWDFQTVGQISYRF
ncbi:MAG: hypothetical protein A3H42_00110 [Deltaproteobacteria bacterium RIFCSPLOWO2_02_FULL_46_8]|nr:MAG: hypothetical protein A3H42_00110 [Deltaproteobacteria bacterium RIFCSPLOWO2_02_FULL_46_8]